jgi:hypothetical protein
MASQLASRAISRSNVDLMPARQAESCTTACEAAAATGPARRRSHFAHYLTHPGELIIPLVFSAVLTAVLIIGFLNRNEGHLTPEHGLGYWLGIIGGGSVLLLLLYPLRKRIKVLRLIGGVTFWFRVHMILGLLGPVLILFHSNFQLGSLNSNVALFAMLIVATSGVVGRYLYTKVHLGLYGRKAAVTEILADVDTLKRLLGDGLPASDRMAKELDDFAKRAMVPRTAALGSFWSMSVLNVRARTLRRRLSAEARWLIKQEGKRRGWSRRVRRERLAAALELIALHLAAARKAGAFAFYERLFSLWHVLHLPLFFLLVLAAILHVVAVHFY